MVEISWQVTHDKQADTLPSLSNWAPMVATSSDRHQHFADDHRVRKAKTANIYMLTYMDVLQGWCLKPE